MLYASIFREWQIDIWLKGKAELGKHPRSAIQSAVWPGTTCQTLITLLFN